MSKLKNDDKSERLAVVFDNHSLFAEALAKLFEELRLFNEVRSFTVEDELLTYFKQKGTKKNIFLFADYYLESKTILPVINDVNRLNKDVKIVIVSSLTNPVLIQNLFTYNIHGIISKSSGTNELIDCVEHIHAKQLYVSSHIREIMENYTETEAMPFSEREMTILHYIAEGLTVDATAEVLNLSRHTVAAHRRKMMNKANCNNVTELLAYARKIDLI